MLSACGDKGGVPRILPLSQEAYQIMWRRQNHHETHFFTFVAQRTRPCPKTGQKIHQGRALSDHLLRNRFQQAQMDNVGVDARIHDLRHTTGSRTLRKTGTSKWCIHTAEDMKVSMRPQGTSAV